MRRYACAQVVFGTTNECIFKCASAHLERMLALGHADPLGIARQLVAFVDADLAGHARVALLRACHTAESLRQAWHRIA